MNASKFFALSLLTMSFAAFSKVQLTTTVNGNSTEAALETTESTTLLATDDTIVAAALIAENETSTQIQYTITKKSCCGSEEVATETIEAAYGEATIIALDNKGSETCSTAELVVIAQKAS